MSFFSSTKEVPEITALPRHIAVIMDGNGRWAKKRFLPRIAGHKRGVDSVRSTVQYCLDHGIEFLTIFAFSSENWRRPADEVSFLMGLFVSVLENEIAKMHKDGVRLKVVGDISRFDQRLVDVILRGTELTAANSKLTLTIAANYGGRWDILQAMNKLLATRSGHLDGFTEDDLSPHLSMAYAPEPDLFIRTGGEKRISNFLLWQLAYTELYFTDILWPDFNEKALQNALASFSSRERRFGRTGDQLKSPNLA